MHLCIYGFAKEHVLYLPSPPSSGNCLLFMLMVEKPTERRRHCRIQNQPFHRIRQCPYSRRQFSGKFKCNNDMHFNEKNWHEVVLRTFFCFYSIYFSTQRSAWLNSSKTRTTLPVLRISMYQNSILIITIKLHHFSKNWNLNGRVWMSPVFVIRNKFSISRSLSPGPSIKVINVAVKINHKYQFYFFIQMTKYCSTRRDIIKAKNGNW